MHLRSGSPLRNRRGEIVRQVAARVARLEALVVEPQGPIEYRVLFADGCPVFPRPGEDPDTPLPVPPGAVVHRCSFKDGTEQAWGRTGEARSGF